MSAERATRRAGLTLIELLLVVAILSALALATVSVVEGADQQVRYEDTKRRLRAIATAIAGDPTLKVDGRPVVSGFVADVGRAPVDLDELVRRDPAAAGTYDYAHEAFPFGAGWAADRGLSSGWRGPYLDALDGVTEEGVRLVFRDGFGNTDPDDPDDPDFAWLHTPPASLGADPVVVESDGGLDPYAGPIPSAAQPLLWGRDYAVDLGAQPLEVELTATGEVEVSGADYRVHVFTRRVDPDGTVVWDAVTSEPDPVTVAAGETTTHAFAFASDSWVSWGRRLVVVYDHDADPPEPLEPAANTPQPLTLLPRAALPRGALRWNLP